MLSLSPSLSLQHYFMHFCICAIYHVIGVTQLVSWDYYKGLQTINFTSSMMWCHSAFNAFKSRISTMSIACFKIISVFYGGDISNL